MDRITNQRARTGPSTLAFHVSRIVIGAGMLIVLAAMSMSFVTGDSGSTDSVAADALPVVMLLAPVFLATLIPDLSRPLLVPLAWGALTLCLIALPFAIVKYLDAANLAGTVGGSVGFGARLLVLGTFVTMTGVALSLAGSLLRMPGSSGTGRPARPTSGDRRPTPPRRASQPASTASRRAQSPAAGARRRSEPGPRPQRRAPDQGSGGGR